MGAVGSLSLDACAGGILPDGVLRRVARFGDVRHRYAIGIHLQHFRLVNTLFGRDTGLAAAQPCLFFEFFPALLSVLGALDEYLLAPGAVVEASLLSGALLAGGLIVTRLQQVEVAQWLQHAALGATLHTGQFRFLALPGALSVALFALMLVKAFAVAVERGDRQHSQTGGADARLYTGHGGYHFSILSSLYHCSPIL